MTLDRPIVFFDIESTGPDPAVDSIVEFGAITLRPDGTRSPRWAQRFKPGILISAEATEVHGITNEEVANCPPFSAWAAKILRGFEGKDLAGYNLRRFDLPILDEEARRCDLKVSLDGVRVVDCFGVFSKKEPRDLTAAVRKFCGRDHAGAHGAGADAEATLDVFLGQMAMYEDLAPMSVQEIADFSVTNPDRKLADLAGKLYLDADGGLRFAFGQHVDRLVLDHVDYAQWMLRKGEFPGSTCEWLRKELSR